MPEAKPQQVKPPQPRTLLDRVPRPPVFATLAEERRHRKERLAASFRLFSRYGFDEGGPAPITARDPSRLSHFWVIQFGVNLGPIRVSHLILFNDPEKDLS